jgi:signal transduction histidine kinase
MPASIRAVSVMAFGAVAAVLVVVGAMGFRTVRRADHANQLVVHTYQVLNSLDRVLTTMVDAETGARGFDVTGQSRYLQPFNQASTELARSLDVVAALTVDNPVQQRNAIELRGQTAATMALLQETVSLDQSNRPIPLDLRDREQASMDAVRATVQRMRLEEQQLMEQRSPSAYNASAATQVVVLGMVAVAFGVLVVSFLFVDRRALQLRHANESLADRVRERTTELEYALVSEQSARKEAEQARAEANAANHSKDVFVARVSHELRTPLNALMGWTQMLRDGQIAPARAPKAIAAIDRSGEALRTLVEDLVEMSRITTGNLLLDRRHLDIVTVVRESVSLLEPAANDKDISVEMDIGSEPVTVAGDPVRLRQIVWNLLSNAIKFTPAKGRVVLRARLTGGEVEISVVDSGQGIVAEFLPHVFEPFSQADGSSRQGLGLGLAITHQLVKAHDGRVTVISPGVGAGTTFSVFLPVVRA